MGIADGSPATQNSQTMEPLSEAEKNPTGYQEVKKNVPTVGRVVYYKSRGSADGVYPPRDFAAIITNVYADDQRIDLVCFSQFGIRFEIGVDNGENPGQWDWMPFQKGIVR